MPKNTYLVAYQDPYGVEAPPLSGRVVVARGPKDAVEEVAGVLAPEDRRHAAFRVLRLDHGTYMKDVDLRNGRRYFVDFRRTIVKVRPEPR